MSIRRSLAYSLAERYAAFCISFVATMMLARLLTPAQIGVYSVGAAFVGLAQILRDFGVGRYIVQERELTEEHVRSTLGVGLILGVLLAGSLFVAASPVASFYDAPELIDVLHVLALSFIVVPFTTPAMALLERELSFHFTFRVNVLNALAHACTGVTLASMGFGPISLAWASFAGVCTSLAALLALGGRSVLRRPSLRHWRRIASFGGQASLASAINHFGSQAPDLIVGRILGFHAVGLYSRAQGLVQMFESQFLRSITTVAFPGYARAHREGHDLRPDYLRGVSLVTVFAWPFFGLLILVAEPLIVVLFGEQWRPSAPVARALCVAGAVAAVWSLVPSLMIAQGRINLFLRLLVVTEGCRIGLILLACIAVASIEAVAWAQLPVALLALLATSYLLGRLAGVTALDIAKAVAPSVLVAAPTVLAGWCASLALEGASGGAIVLGVGTAGAVTWLIAIYTSGHPAAPEISLAANALRKRIAAGAPRRKPAP